MRPLRTVLLTFVTVAAVVCSALPASADENPTADFEAVSTSFTPNGDGVNDVFEAKLTVSAAAHVTVLLGSTAAPHAVLLDQSTDEAGSFSVRWHGRYGETVQNNETVNLYAIVDWASGGSVTRQVAAYPYTADGVELSSPGAGAVLFGDVPIRWKRHVYWQFDFDVSGCGSFHQNLGESGSQYPSSFDFSATATPYQSFDASRCSPGEHTLTVTGKPGWSPSREYLQVASIPIIIPGDGPQLVLQPDLAAADKVQTLLRYGDEQVAPISWPVRCRDAVASSFVMRIQNSDGEVVRTFRGLGSAGSDTCRADVLPGASWDGRDDHGDPVPDGTYAVEAEIGDAEGRTASDRAEVVVRQADPPLTLTSVSPGDSLGGTASLVWRPAAGATVHSIAIKVSGCEQRKPYGWWNGPLPDGGSAQSIDISMCPPGPRELIWSADWSDADGVHRVFTQRVPVTLVDDKAPSLRQWGYGNLLTPSQPGRMNLEWFLTCTDVSPVDLSIVVRDSSGTDVATLRKLSPTACTDWEESNTHQYPSWDGVGDDGNVVAAGKYTVVARAIDAAGNASQNDWPIVVEPRPPFRASIGAGGAVGPDDAVTWTPRDGVTAMSADPYPRASAHLAVDDASPVKLPVSHPADGGLRVSGVGQQCTGHDATLSVSIDWQDDAGGFHTWDETIPIRCADRSQPLPALAARLTGTARMDQTLGSQVAGLVAGEQPAYRWQRDGRDIAGAGKDSYRLVAADVGHAIRLQVSVTGSAARVAMSAAVRAQPGTLVSAAPTVRGTTRVGGRLTVSSAAWRPAGVALSYQWLRNARPVSRATKSSYALTAADRGARISVRVSGRKPGYATATRTSAATARIR